ncbi:hypothetical protein [Aquamicrobium sp.]|uniref:hypothetical protein n=1 Tax=Aquamicrobium sp. TaxID=1872579 RepID=UPI002584B8E0|nr:hypothetical protein [Aquamicrobium sp.]MCK9549208.1 hypothetical protein [Aquamicrobium sp.]
MARTTKYHVPMPLAMAALGTGVALAGTDTWSNMEFILGSEKGLTSLVAAVPVASVAAMLALPAARAAWRAKKKFEAGLLACVLVAATTFSLSATLDRTSQTREAQLAERKSANMAATLARQALDEAKADVARFDAEAAAERTRGGCGPVCKSWEAKADAARVRVAEAIAQVRTAGAERAVDTLAASVAYFVPVSEKTVATVQPMLLPAVMYLGGLGFIGVGAGAMLDRKPPRKAPTRKASRKAPPKRRSQKTRRSTVRKTAPQPKGVVLPFTR